MVNRIQDEILKRRDYDAEMHMLERFEGAGSPRLALLKGRLAMIDSWLTLLQRDEAFVVKLHLMDGLDWSRMEREYRRLWGDAHARSARSLRRCQTAALLKIAAFVAAHPNLYGELLP